MKKYIRMFAGAMVCTLLLSGCGGAKLPDTIDKTTISIAQNGEITAWLVEEFNREYYSISELQEMAATEAAAYNAEHGGDGKIPITVERVEALGNGDRVIVQYIYDKDETYAGYNESVFFYGTVEEAVMQGYDLTESFSSVKDGTVMSSQEVMKKPEKSYVLITEAKAAIYCPRKVTYVSGNVTAMEDGSVDTTKTEGVAILLMK